MCYGPCCHDAVMVVCHGRFETALSAIGNVTRMDSETGDLLWTYDLGIATLPGFKSSLSAAPISILLTRRASSAFVDADGNIYVAFDWGVDVGLPAITGAQPLGFPGSLWDTVPSNGGLVKLDSDGNFLWRIEFPPTVYFTDNPEGPCFWYNIIEPWSLLQTGSSFVWDVEGYLWVGSVSDNDGNYIYRIDPTDGSIVAKYGELGSFNFPYAWPAAAGRTAIESHSVTSQSYGAGGSSRAIGGKITSKDGSDIVFCAGSHVANYGVSSSIPYNTVARMDLNGNVSFATKWGPFGSFPTSYYAQSGDFTGRKRQWYGLITDPVNGDVYGVAPKTIIYNGQPVSSPYELGIDQYEGGALFTDVVGEDRRYHVTQWIAKFTKDDESSSSSGHSSSSSSSGHSSSSYSSHSSSSPSS